MQKIDIICHRYQLTQKNGYIKLEDVIKKVLRKDRIEKILDNINENIIIIENEKYITYDKFKEICNTNKWYKTAEINYIFNTNVDFDIIKFGDNLIHIIIKNNIKYYRLCNLGEILEYKSHMGEKVYYNDKYKLKELLDTSICTLFGNDSNTIFVTEIGVKILLLRSRRPIDIIEKLAEKLKININLHTDKVVAKESNYITQIKLGLPDNTIINYQYCVDDYFVDMYLPEYNLVIECDEYGHTKYNNEKDKERETYIKNKLKCDFLRFNPDEKNFNIILVVKKIYEKIMANFNTQNLPSKKIKVKSQIQHPQKIIINDNKEKDIDIITENKKDIQKENNIIVINNENIKNIELIKFYEPIKSQKSNKCIDCDNEIYYGNQRCTFCMNKKKFEDNCKQKNRPTKEKLIKDVNELGYKGTGENIMFQIIV